MTLERLYHVPMSIIPIRQNAYRPWAPHKLDRDKMHEQANHFDHWKAMHHRGLSRVNFFLSLHPGCNRNVRTLTILSKVNDYVSIFCVICQLLESNISNFFPYSESIAKCLFSQFRRHIRRITHNRPCDGLILGRIWPLVLTRVNSITSWTRFETITT